MNNIELSHEQIKEFKQMTDKKTKKDIDKALILLREIIAKKTVTFNTENMDKKTTNFLRECLGKMITRRIKISPPYGELIWRGIQKGVVIPNENEIADDFHILESGDIQYGFIRFYNRKKLSGKELENTYDKHFITEKQIRVIEGQEKENKSKLREYNYYEVREFIPFKKHIIKPNKWTAISEILIRNEWNIKECTDLDLMGLHSEIHNKALSHSLLTKKQPEKEDIILHSEVVRELETRKFGHMCESEIDRLTEKLLKSEKELIYLSEIMPSIKNTVIRENFISIMGDEVMSGKGETIKLCLNIPKYDTRTIESVKAHIMENIKDEYRDRIEFCIAEGSDVNKFVPVMNLKIEIIPPSERKMIQAAPAYFEEKRRAGR